MNNCLKTFLIHYEFLGIFEMLPEILVNEIHRVFGLMNTKVMIFCQKIVVSQANSTRYFLVSSSTVAKSFYTS